MKKSITALLALFFLVRAFAQTNNVEIYWGKFNAEDRWARTTLIGKRGNNLFAQKISRSKVSILKYNMTDLQVTGEYPIVLESDNADDAGKYLFDKIITLRNHFYVTAKRYNRKTKENSLYAQEIGDNGQLSGKMRKLETIDSKSTFNRGDFDLVESDDSTRLLLIDYPPYEKYGGEKFTLTTLDESLNQIKKMQVEMPFKNKYFDLYDYSYGRDGIIYMMAKIWLDKDEKTKGESKYYNELISIDPSGDGSVNQYDIKIPQKYISGIAYRTDDPKNVVCSGFYGDVSGTAKDEITGVFYLRIDKSTRQVVATGLKQLDKEFIADLTSERKANKGKGISNDFKLQHFVRKSDGGAVLFAELNYWYAVTTTTSTGNGGMTTTTHYHYIRNNIIAINVNPDGSIKWCANIPKKQHTVDDNGVYSSYCLFTKDKTAYLIFNDHPDNMDPKRLSGESNMKTMTNPKGSSAVLVQLTEDGKFSKQELFSNKENKVTLMPDADLWIGGNSYIIPAYNPGFWCCFSFSAAKSKLAKFTFKG